ncbi:hypothetical protein [Thalassobacillus sp. C254]|uniref:hypothetical protein n=1 Tax=Thalassobacillus sp. C254 TaxID=1225341 RepID=UPI0006D1C094|nr:hypothetical protein [Thalassobacillus sp. C254]
MSLKKKIIQFLVLKQVQGSPAHLAEIHRSISEGIKEDDLSPNRSRTYVYKTIKEMDEQGWISHHQEGRKKIFSLCHTGRMVLDDFRERYIPLLTSIEKAVKQMILNVTSKEFHDVPWTLSEEEKRYLSKILNVKSFIRWYILHQLLEKKNAMPENSIGK